MVSNAITGNPLPPPLHQMPVNGGGGGGGGVPVFTPIHLQFGAYGSRDSLLPISMSPTANFYVQNTIFAEFA